MRFAEISTSKIKNVQLLDCLGYESNIIGTIHITTTHFIFKAENSGKEIWIQNNLIGLFERGSISAAGSRLTIKCKNFMVLNLLLAKNKDCQNLYETLANYCKIYNINDCYAFVSKNLSSKQKEVTSSNSNIEVDNWWRLDWGEEFKRQGVSNLWKETNFNQNYAYCDTYPERLWVPEIVTLQNLIGSCRFRSKARLPVLTYFLKKNGASICRCSQPLTGFNSRCVEDESLMNLIMQTNTSRSPLFLVDARPKVNAMVNKVQGKGFEDVRNYNNMQFHFFDIENIHVMRNSITKLLEACQRPMSLTEYYKTVDNSGWLRHLRALLECGNFIAETVFRGTSCVVHCSDGWDRTSQAVALAQIILDSYYRTIKGFQVLLDKDWMGFGYKFDDRCSHISTANEDDISKEISPIFTQFLDVVWQLLRKKPLDFEFNERFLLEINDHAYSCEFGNFIGNCDKDRKNLKVTQRTQSLWNYMDKQIDDYINPFYKKNNAVHLINVDLRPSAFIVWSAMYNRFDTGIQPREYLSDVALKSQQHIKFLESVIQDNNPKFKNLNIAVEWQSLLNADECSTPQCGREFMSRFEKRNHCYICGKIFCKRCFCIKQKENICNNCFAKT